MCSCQEWQGPAACVSSGLGDAVHSFWTRSLLSRGQLSRISEGHACSNLSIDRHQKYDFDYVDVQCIDMCLSAACLSMFRQLYMTQEAPESWRNWNHERAGTDTQLSRLYIYIIIHHYLIYVTAQAFSLHFGTGLQHEASAKKCTIRRRRGMSSKSEGDCSKTNLMPGPHDRSWHRFFDFLVLQQTIGSSGNCENCPLLEVVD